MVESTVLYEEALQEMIQHSFDVVNETSFTMEGIAYAVQSSHTGNTVHRLPLKISSTQSGIFVAHQEGLVIGIYDTPRLHLKLSKADDESTGKEYVWVCSPINTEDQSVIQIQSGQHTWDELMSQVVTPGTELKHLTLNGGILAIKGYGNTVAVTEVME